MLRNRSFVTVLWLLATHQRQLFHQAPCTIAAEWHSSVSHHAGNDSGSSRATTLTVGRANKRFELGSLWLLSRAAFAPILIATSLNTKGLTQSGNRVALLQTAHHHKLFSVSDIKRAVASRCPWGIFRMSFFVSMRRTFFSSSLIRR